MGHLIGQGDVMGRVEPPISSGHIASHLLTGGMSYINDQDLCACVCVCVCVCMCEL